MRYFLFVLKLKSTEPYLEAWPACACAGEEQEAAEGGGGRPASCAQVTRLTGSTSKQVLV